jgi:hypothetical protein
MAQLSIPHENRSRPIQGGGVRDGRRKNGPEQSAAVTTAGHVAATERDGRGHAASER